MSVPKNNANVVKSIQLSKKNNFANYKSECQTVISLQNLLLSQTQVSFGNSYRAMVESFRQLY